MPKAKPRKVLTPEQIEARNETVMENQGLVVSIAKQYRGRGAAMDDLVQQGSLGLIRASEDFDASRGVLFATYAVYRIRSSIANFLMNENRAIRVPADIYLLAARWRRREKSMAAAGLPCCFDSVADALGLNDSHRGLVACALKADCRSMALSGSHDPFGIAASPIDPGAAIEESEDRQEFRRRFSALSRLEQDVVSLRHGLEGGDVAGYREIAGRLNISRVWADRTDHLAIAKMSGEAHPYDTCRSYGKKHKAAPPRHPGTHPAVEGGGARPVGPAAP